VREARPNDNRVPCRVPLPRRREAGHGLSRAGGGGKRMAAFPSLRRGGNTMLQVQWRQFACGVAVPLLLALAACATPLPASRQSVSSGGTVTVRLSDFAFDPSTLRLRAGVPVRLRLQNVSDGGHDFSAPAFFAASSFPQGETAPANGRIDVASGQTVELTVVPRSPGTYALECTHLLHAMLGMTGQIEVVP
jgi:uncharacterized cupredoxin-like copper-binding protein